MRHANGSSSGNPLFFFFQDLPPSIDLKTPFPKAHAYNTLEDGSLAESSNKWVTADSPRLALTGFHDLPPSSRMTIPPIKSPTPLLRHILGLGRSCVPLIAAQILFFIFGSITTQ
jgi:hypothetical protein